MKAISERLLIGVAIVLVLGGDSPLTTWFTERGIFACDDMSGIILTSFYRHLHGQDIRRAEQIEDYQLFWRVRYQVPSAEVYELIDAIAEHDLEKAQSLVEKGADVKAARYDGHNAVMEAVICRKLDILKYLVQEQGMDINLPCERGYPPIVHLYEQLEEPGAYDILEFVIDKGADVNAPDWGGLTLLQRAKRFHHDKVVELLQAKGVLKEG